MNACVLKASARSIRLAPSATGGLVRHPLSRVVRWVQSIALALGIAAPTAAQLPPASQKTPVLKYNTSVGPSALRAAVWNDPCCEIFLVWPAVFGAEKYRVTRSSFGAQEATILEAPLTSFVHTNFGYTCTAPLNSAPTGCVVGDVKASKGVSYTYRVWAIYPGGVASPASPPSSATLP